MIYECPKGNCEGELEEIQIGVGGDETIPGVMCNTCEFYTDVDGFQEYIEYDKEQ